MARVLGQSAPSSNTDTSLYTTPSGRRCVVSSLSISNTGAASATCRVAIRPAGEALAAKHYLLYDEEVPVGSSRLVVLGVDLDATDVVTVRSSTGNAAFTLIGDEIIP